MDDVGAAATRVSKRESERRQPVGSLHVSICGTCVGPI